MARQHNRLPSANFAPLIQEAINRNNPEMGLTEDELVTYVFSRLGFDRRNIQERVEEFLNAGTSNGALLKTDHERYQLVETGGRRLRAALDACCTTPPSRPRPRPIHCCRQRCCMQQRCNLKGKNKKCRATPYRYVDTCEACDSDY
ncbi:unnamed protein product [Nezara viridula]|uniref:Uncharacterized protein n=1 Tax=Nezara viridula TaxID=85310 RepID=A0A9P0EEK8_NEZVI|nr:unnamed protein product [Nezara viridula]